MLPLLGFVLPDVEFAEGAVLHDVTVGAHGLFEDFLAVGDKEQLQITAGRLTQAFVVKGGDDSFPGTGRRDHEVVVETLEPLGLQVLEHLLLVEEGPEFEAGGCPGDCGASAALAFQGGVQSFAVAVGIVALESALRPVAVEGDLELLQQRRRADGAEPDVPFEPVEQSCLAEVGTADVGGVEARVPAEQPGLGMQAGGLGLVADLHFGAVSGHEFVDGAAFRGAHVGGRDDTEFGATFPKLFERRMEQAETRPTDEGA